MEKFKIDSNNLGKEIFKKSLVIKEKFNECFLDFNDFNKKVDFDFRFTKYDWYSHRYIFTEEDLLRNDFFDKFHLEVFEYNFKKEEFINCIEMFAEYIDYEYEIDIEFKREKYIKYNFIFKKIKVKKKRSV